MFYSAFQEVTCDLKLKLRAHSVCKPNFLHHHTKMKVFSLQGGFFFHYLREKHQFLMSSAWPPHVLSSWKSIIDHLLTHEKTMFKDLMSEYSSCSLLKMKSVIEVHLLLWIGIAACRERYSDIDVDRENHQFIQKRVKFKLFKDWKKKDMHCSGKKMERNYFQTSTVNIYPLEMLHPLHVFDYLTCIFLWCRYAERLLETVC